MAKRTQYIDNKVFLDEMVKHRQRLLEAERNHLPKPRLPEYVGECFMMIAENLSHKSNFISYTFRDEMISDAIENCVLYADNFDPTKSQNPFAYFTQIVYYAFLRRIQREKKQLYVKYKSAIELGVMDEYNQLESEDGINRQFDMYENISQFVDNYETAKANKLEKKKINLEKFVEDSE